MISSDAPKGHAAQHAGIRHCGDGYTEARGRKHHMSFGHALQSDHAGTFGVNVIRVPIDFAAVLSATARHLRVHAGRLAAPARG